MLCRTHRSRYTKFNTSAKHMSSNQSDGGLEQTVWWAWKLRWKNTDSPFASWKTARNFRADFLGCLCRGFCLFWISLQKNNMFIYAFYSHLCKNEKCKAVHKKQLNAARRKSVSALRQWIYEENWQNLNIWSFASRHYAVPSMSSRSTYITQLREKHIPTQKFYALKLDETRWSLGYK